MSGFYKLSGSGNDFLALVEPEREPTSEEVAAWCARGLSLGADGLFVLRRSPAGARMLHYNADGRRAALCVNGSRCAARLAFELGWAAERLELATDAGPIAAERVGADEIALALPAPGRPEPAELVVGERRLAGHRVAVGVPHLVLVWPQSLARAPVAELGPPLRAHPALGEAGANVDFVRFTGRRRLEIRTFERGVEAETLACGTGVLAAAAVGVETGSLELPAAALTAGGFELRVAHAGGSDGAARWSLAGDARIVAQGTLHPGAGRPPRPAAWS